MNTITSRLDELFSPERLDENWQTKIMPVLELPQISYNSEIHANNQELQRLVEKKFPDISRLSGNFDELTEHINQNFPLDAATDTATAKSKQAVVFMLEQLEELLWALDLSLRVHR